MSKTTRTGRRFVSSESYDATHGSGSHSSIRSRMAPGQGAARDAAYAKDRRGALANDLASIAKYNARGSSSAPSGSPSPSPSPKPAVRPAPKPRDPRAGMGTPKRSPLSTPSPSSRPYQAPKPFKRGFGGGARNSFDSFEDSPSSELSPEAHQREREDRQRKRARDRIENARQPNDGGKRMAYRPKTAAMTGPKKHSRWGETHPVHRQIARAGAELESTDYKTVRNQGEDMSIFDSIVKQESARSLFDGLVEGSKPSGSLFDGIVEGSTKGIFDGIVEGDTPSGSLFDGIVEDRTAKSGPDWDDRVARTMTLSESLVDLCNTYTKK